MRGISAAADSSFRAFNKSLDRGDSQMAFFGLFGKDADMDADANRSAATVDFEDMELSAKEYESNAALDEKFFCDYLDKNVSVIVRGPENWEPFIDYAVNIFFNHETLMAQLKKLQTRKGVELGVIPMRLGDVLDRAVWNGDCKAVFIFGLKEQKMVLSRKDLGQMRDSLDCYSRVYGINSGTLDIRPGIAELKKSWVYIIGELPRPNEDGVRNSSEEYWVKTTTNFGDEELVECYFTKDEAKRHAGEEFVSAAKLGEILEFCGPLVVEPYSSNWLKVGGKQPSAYDYFVQQKTNN